MGMFSDLPAAIVRVHTMPARMCHCTGIWAVSLFIPGMGGWTRS